MEWEFWASNRPCPTKQTQPTPPKWTEKVSRANLSPSSERGRQQAVGCRKSKPAVRFSLAPEKQREERSIQRGGDTTARRLPPRWRCVSSPGSTSASPLLPSTGTPRATRGPPPPTHPSSAAGSPPRRPPRPPPPRVGRRARGGRSGTCSAWPWLWSALPTLPSRYIAASARLPATAAPSNDARSGSSHLPNGDRSPC